MMRKDDDDRKEFCTGQQDRGTPIKGHPTQGSIRNQGYRRGKPAAWAYRGRYYGIRPGIPPCATSEDQGQSIPHLYQCCASPFEIALTPRFLNTSYAAIKSDSPLICGQDPKG